MQEEITEVDDLAKLQTRVPFLIHLPNKFDPTKVTYRNAGRKWPTLRFECEIDNENLRVKQFFLDWFYPGFPKSLMSSFVSTYSRVNTVTVDERVIFYGRNYKGKAASSSYSLGTQIEVEGETETNVKKLSESMEAPFMPERFKRFPFYKRSFFANGGRPEWFEEERIANLSWKMPSKRLCVGSLCLDSVGYLKQERTAIKTILVFSEEYYRRAAWVEIAPAVDKTDHFVYDLRNSGNFFNYFLEDNPVVAFKGDSGPAIARFKDGDSLVTISLSPMFQFSNAMTAIEELRDATKEQERFI
jgi:hypothetical protein